MEIFLYGSKILTEMLTPPSVDHSLFPFNENFVMVSTLLKNVILQDQPLSFEGLRETLISSISFNAIDNIA